MMNDDDYDGDDGDDVGHGGDDDHDVGGYDDV